MFFVLPVYNRLRQAARANYQQIRQRGSFAQNFAIAFSGTASVAVLGILVTPIMSRLYPPASYGAFAVFNTLVNNINLISTFGYTMTFVLPRQHKRFLALVQLCFLLTGAAFVLTMLGIVVLHDPLLRWLNAEALNKWIYMVPVTVLFFNLYMIMQSWYLRTKDFRKRAGIEVITAVAGRSLTLGYGWLAHGPVGGLIVGDIFSKVVGSVSLLFSGFHRNIGELYSTFSWRRIGAVIREYREYPLYVLPTAYLNVLASQLPIFFLTTSFSTATVGLYAFSNTLLELPINVIGNAISPVSLQKATETHQREPEKLAGLCLSLYYKLFYLGVVPFGIISVFGDWIFRFAFGARWEMAGLFTAYLGYYYMFKLASYGVGPIYAVLQRQRLGLLVTILLVLVRAASLFIGSRTHDLALSMQLFGIGSFIVTFGIDMHMLHLIRVRIWGVVLRSVSLMLLTLGTLWGLRMLLHQLFDL